MRKILFLITVFYSGLLKAQIVDDSTKLVYGPKTTRFIYEHQVLNNQVKYQTIDSVLKDFDRMPLVEKSANRYQNLGSFGTAVFPVFHRTQDQIGRTSGFNAYSIYDRSPNTIKYYDTKSPFIDLVVYLGGANRNIVNVDFSRNIRPGWNVGFDLHKITTDKQLAGAGKADRQVVGTSFDIYTHYKHEKLPYQALLSFSNKSHEVAELGGVLIQNSTLPGEIFNLGNANPQLRGAQNVVKNSRWHLYQDYQLTDEFQVYHKLDIYNERNVYKDFAGGEIINNYNSYTNFYPNFFIDKDSTHEKATFSSFENEAGLKGDLSNLFYRVYLKFRTVDFNYFLTDPFEKQTEKYLGGYVRFNWRDKFAVIGEGELQQGGVFKLKGTLSSDVFTASYLTKRYSVPYIYRHYFGNHYFWNNSFDPVSVNEIEAKGKFNYKIFTFIPKVRATTYGNYLYVDRDSNKNIRPRQASSNIIVASGGGQVNFVLNNKKGEGFHFESEVMATTVTGSSSNVIRIPNLFFNGRYYWKGDLFGDKVPIEVGVGTHARTSYFANGYDPVTQQFYLQDELKVSSYFKTDLFFNMRLDKFYVGLKWIHFNQPSNGGYYATPYFPGQPKTIDLIIRWMFFD